LVRIGSTQALYGPSPTVEEIARQVQGQSHRVAVVVVRDVVAPVQQRRRRFAGIRTVPVVDIDHAVAAVGFDDRRDQGNDFRTDLANVRRLVDGQTVAQLH
jgi:hypothetical protein